MGRKRAVTESLEKHKGDTLCSFPSGSYLAFPPLLFIFQSSPQKKRQEGKKPFAFCLCFSHSSHFSPCFCSLVLPILILPKLPFPEAQGHFTPSTKSEWKNSQGNSQPLAQSGLSRSQRGKITCFSPLIQAETTKKILGEEQRKSPWAPVRL